MTPRILILIWLAAAVPALAATLFATQTGRALDGAAIESVEAALERADAEIAVIGSSMARNALPPESGSDGIFGTGHVRVALGNITARETLDLLENALDTGFSTVLVEGNRLVTARDGSCPMAGKGIAERIARRIQQLSFDARRTVIFHATGGGSARLHEAKNLDGAFKFSPRMLDAFGTRRLCALDAMERFTDLVARAREEGVEIVLLGYPRPRSYVEHYGQAARMRTYDHLAAQAAAAGIAWFQPAPEWPDALFADHVHLNRAGRARYQRELADWFAARR